MGAAIDGFMVVPPSPGAFDKSAPVATAFEIASANNSRTQAIFKGNRCRDGKGNRFKVHDQKEMTVPWA